MLARRDSMACDSVTATFCFLKLRHEGRAHPLDHFGPITRVLVEPEH